MCHLQPVLKSQSTKENEGLQSYSLHIRVVVRLHVCMYACMSVCLKSKKRCLKRLVRLIRNMLVISNREVHHGNE